METAGGSSTTEGTGLSYHLSDAAAGQIYGFVISLIPCCTPQWQPIHWVYYPQYYPPSQPKCTDFHLERHHNELEPTSFYADDEQ